MTKKCRTVKKWKYERKSVLALIRLFFIAVKRGLYVPFLICNKYAAEIFFIFKAAVRSDGCNPVHLFLKEDIIMAKKFTEEQTAVFRKCIRAGLSIEDIKNPDYNVAQLHELYLAKKAGLDISLYSDPAISAETMREIRRTAAADVDVGKLVHTVVQTGAYNDSQAKEIMDAARRGLNLKNMLNPELNALQMKQIKFGERDGIDTGVYADSAFSAEQMQKLRFELVVQKIIERLKEFFSQAWNKFVNWVREELPAEQVQGNSYAEDSAEQFISDKIYKEVCIYFESEQTEETGETLQSVTEKISKKIISGELMAESEIQQKQEFYNAINEPPVIIVEAEFEEDLAMEM